MDDGAWSVRWSVIPWWAKMCAMAKTLPTAKIRLKLPVLLMAAGASLGVASVREPSTVILQSICGLYLSMRAIGSCIECFRSPVSLVVSFSQLESWQAKRKAALRFQAASLFRLCIPPVYRIPHLHRLAPYAQTPLQSPGFSCNAVRVMASFKIRTVRPTVTRPQLSNDLATPPPHRPRATDVG